MEPQPPPHPWWIDAIEVAKSLKEAFIFPAVLAIWALIKRRDSRKDSQHQNEVSDFEKLLASTTGNAATWMKQAKQDQDELRAEFAEERAKRRAAEQDRDRWAGLARAWCNAAHQTWHVWSNLMSMIPPASRPPGVAEVQHLSLDVEKPS